MEDLLNSLASALQAPTYHIYFEIILISGIIWLIFQRSYNIKDQSELTAKEKRKLIDEWTPDPLVPTSWSIPEGIDNAISKNAKSAMKKYVEYESSTNGLNHLNLLTYNFLDLTGNNDVQESSISAMRHYGVGSCGPRSFYGTYDAHLNLEKDLKNFLEVEDVILYSFGFSTIASAIPSYAKRTDIVYADEFVSQSIHQGLIASRSKVVYFKHNDISHLERLLEEQANKDKSDPQKAQSTRKFIIVEGIYQDTGSICNLPEIIELKYKYKVRVFIDEAISIGVLGANGKGVTEHFGIAVNNIDLISGSLECGLANYGGFCAGSTFVVDHQCLSGAGYCFSASPPPMLAVAMQHTLKILAKEKGQRQKKLKNVAKRFNEIFSKPPLNIHWTLEGDDESPIKFIRLKEGNSKARLEKVVSLAFEWSEGNPLLLTLKRGVETASRKLRPPSIRLSLNCNLSEEEIKHIVEVFNSIGNKLIFTSC